MASTHRAKSLRLGLLLLAVLFARSLSAQIATGRITGKVRDVEGEAINVSIFVSSAPGYRAAVHTDPRGAFSLNLLYGRYELSVQLPSGSISTSVPIDVEPLQNQNIVIVIDTAGQIR